MIFPDGVAKEGLFDNNVYKGPAKQGEAPAELAGNFDVMSLAPPEVFFSEEVKNFVPAMRPGSYMTPQRRFPTAAPAGRQSDEENVSRDTGYSMPPVLPGPSRHETRSFSKEYRRPPRGATVLSRPARSSSNVRSGKRSFVNTSRTLGEQVSARMLRRSPPTNTTSIMYAQSHRNVSPLKARQMNRQKKIWVPSGKVHYADIPFGKIKYFS